VVTWSTHRRSVASALFLFTYNQAALVGYIESALFYFFAALQQASARPHHRLSNRNFGCAVSYIPRIFAFRRNPIHGPGALLKGSEYEGQFHRFA
jgi:hypothetical protein